MLQVVGVLEALGLTGWGGAVLVLLLAGFLTRGFLVRVLDSAVFLVVCRAVSRHQEEEGGKQLVALFQAYLRDRNKGGR